MSPRSQSGFTPLVYLADKRLVLTGEPPTWWVPPADESIKVVEVSKETTLHLQKRAMRTVEERHGRTVISRQTEEVDLEDERIVIVPKGSQLKLFADRRYIINDVQDPATGELFQLSVSTEGVLSLRSYQPSSGFNDDITENPFVS